jgi:hypothetical protein
VCDLDDTGVSSLFVYYQSIKRKLNRRIILECRCDERLKSKSEGSTRLVYTGDSGGIRVVN